MTQISSFCYSRDTGSLQNTRLDMSLLPRSEIFRHHLLVCLQLLLQTASLMHRPRSDDSNKWERLKGTYWTFCEQSPWQNGWKFHLTYTWHKANIDCGALIKSHSSCNLKQQIQHKGPMRNKVCTTMINSLKERACKIYPPKTAQKAVS